MPLRPFSLHHQSHRCPESSSCRDAAPTDLAPSCGIDITHEGVIEGLDILKDRFAELMEAGKRYLSLAKGKRGDKAAEAVLEHFRDKEARQELYKYFRSIEELHEIISPDPFMRPFLRDYGLLSEMYELVRGSYDRGKSVDKSFLRKTAALVSEHASTSGIQAPTEVQKLDSEMLEAIAEGDQPDAVKVFNLLKVIRETVARDGDKEPYLISIGEKAEKIVQAFEDRQQNTQQTLFDVKELVREAHEARQRREDSDLPPEAFAVQWALEKEGVQNADGIARQLAGAFETFPHWQTSSHQEQESRKAFYKALIDADVDGVVDVAKNVLKMLRRDS